MQYGFGVVKHDQHLMWYQAMASGRHTGKCVFLVVTEEMGLSIGMVMGQTLGVSWATCLKLCWFGLEMQCMYANHIVHMGFQGRQSRVFLVLYQQRC